METQAYDTNFDSIANLSMQFKYQKQHTELFKMMNKLTFVHNRLGIHRDKQYPNT
jgi:hypothetical protein